MLSVAVQTENREKFVRRDMAITLGALPGAAEGSSRAEPITHEVAAKVEEMLREAVLVSVQAAQAKSRPLRRPA